MNGLTRNIFATISVCLLAADGLSGCANTAKTIALLQDNSRYARRD